MHDHVVYRMFVCRHKQEVQKTATKQVHQKYQVHTLQPSQSTNQLEAMANE